MPNPYGAPELSPTELKPTADGSEPFVWLDVREPWEFRKVQIRNERVQLVPLSEIAERQLDALPPAAQDKSATIVVQCHHGVRSMQVAAFLSAQGFARVANVAGGINAWSAERDPRVPAY